MVFNVCVVLASATEMEVPTMTALRRRLAELAQTLAEQAMPRNASRSAAPPVFVPRPLSAIGRGRRASDAEASCATAAFDDSAGVNGEAGPLEYKGLIGIGDLNASQDCSEVPQLMLLDSTMATVREGTRTSSRIHTVAMRERVA